MHKTSNLEMERCIKNCVECHNVCLQTVAYCLEKGGSHAQKSHIGLLLNCAEICQTSADFMLSGSDLHPRTCLVCAEVCERCADACDQFGDDEVMKKCAEICRQCAASCRSMSGGARKVA